MRELETLRSLSDLLSLSESELQKIVERPSGFYTSFTYNKADGSPRVITPPTGELMRIQSVLHGYLKKRILFKKCVNGGVPHRSIITNARPHVGKQMVAKLDIKSFFPNTKPDYVKAVFLGLGCTESASEMLCGLTVYRGGLPQGAPTSLFLGNMVLSGLDNAFLSLTKKHGFAYTRFVDDITVSSRDKDLRDFKAAFEGIIVDSGFDPAPGKTIFKDRSKPQIVTGLIVNDVLRPSPWFLRELKRTIVDSWPENYGVERVAAANEVSVKGLRASICGKINFVRSVDKMKGNHLRQLLTQVKWP